VCTPLSLETLIFVDAVCSTWWINETTCHLRAPFGQFVCPCWFAIEDGRVGLKTLLFKKASFFLDTTSTPCRLSRRKNRQMLVPPLLKCVVRLCSKNIVNWTLARTPHLKREYGKATSKVYDPTFLEIVQPLKSVGCSCLWKLGGTVLFAFVGGNEPRAKHNVQNGLRFNARCASVTL
jgi:hypothetical protein